MKSKLSTVLLIALLFFGGSVLFFGGACFNAFHKPEAHVAKPSVVVLDLEGVIMSSKKFVKTLKKYREMDQVKAIVIRVNSPGGAVGPSQEIYDEVRNTVETFKKPVVVSVESLAASGAYYVSVGASKVITQPGSLMGSIGVIMEFANIKDLYQWAKIKRFVIKTGVYKDIGSEFRDMTDNEKSLLQNVINEVYGQFKMAISKGRKLPMSEVEKYADGRIFSGETAVRLKFADAVGGFQKAVDTAGELAGLGKNPEVVEPAKHRPDVMELFDSLNGDDEDSKTQVDAASLFRKIAHTDLIGKPLFIYPGALLAF